MNRLKNRIDTAAYIRQGILSIQNARTLASLWASEDLLTMLDHLRGDMEQVGMEVDKHITECKDAYQCQS